jgi:hypothetical protein
LRDDKVIVVVAPVGALTFVEKAPNLPITPEEIAEEACKAYEKGATTFGRSTNQVSLESVHREISSLEVKSLSRILSSER